MNLIHTGFLVPGNFNIWKPMHLYYLRWEKTEFVFIFPQVCFPASRSSQKRKATEFICPGNYNEGNFFYRQKHWSIRLKISVKSISRKKFRENDFTENSIFCLQEFCEFRAKCGLLWCYDWVSIPMVYTQVVTLATYVFFIFTVIGRQKIDMAPNETSMRSGRIPLDIDLYIPVYTILQFFFYMGLLKVAEQLINPFGDDDEDFELNWLVDRHMKVLSLLGALCKSEPITNSLYLFFYRPRSLAVTFLWILIGSHQWLRTIIGINKIVQFHTLKHLCTLKEKRILALLLSSCKKYILIFFPWLYFIFPSVLKFVF